MLKNKIAISKNYITSIAIICLMLFAFITIIDTVNANNLNQTDNNYEANAIDIEDKLENSQNKNVLQQKTWNFNNLPYSELQNYIFNNVTDGDTIYLDGEFYADKENSEIYLYKNITITSNTKAIFNGKGISSAFIIQNGSQGSVFSNLIFKNGKGFTGGALFILGSDITIKNCEFSNNHATFSGGAIYSDYDVITNPDIGKNILVDNCKFINNSAANAAGALGLYGDKVKVINSIFDSNYVINSGSAMVYGGAIQIGRDDTPFTALIKNTSFINNKAISSPGGKNSHGGAGCVRNGTTYENCIFIGNTADHGGALTYHGSGRIKNCTFKDNVAYLFGGALSTGYIDLFMNLTIIDCKFNNNSAPYGGAAQLNGMGIIVDTCDFTNNHASTDGGGVYLNAETTSIKNTDFTNNQALNNGGAIFVNSKSTNIERSNFKLNSAIPSDNSISNGLGGAIYINGTTNTIQYNVFEHNIARNGSAIYNDKSSKNLNVTGNTMTENQAWVYALPIYAEDIYYGDDEKFSATIYGGNNIGAYNKIDVSNAIYNDASFNFITVNNQVPLNGATNTGELYQDGREYNIDVNLTIIHSDGTVVYNKKLKTNYLGEVNDVLSNLKPGKYTLNAVHNEDNYYKAISNTTTFTVKPKVDISITKTAENKNYKYHDEITWYIEAKNNGPNDATGVNVTDILSNGLILQEYVSSKGTYSNGIWKIGDLKTNESCGIHIKTKINKTGIIINSANAISNENDTNMSNNQASHTITVAPAIDLMISKKANNTTPNYGDLVKWTITIINKGIDAASNVTIKDILPDTLTLLNGTHEYNLFVGNLDVNQSFSVDIITRVNGTESIENIATVSGEEYDINLTNNQISEFINVKKAADLEIKKTVNNSNPKLNDLISWKITVKNNGPNDATNIKVKDILPSGLIYESSYSAKGNYSNSVWNIDYLNNNEIATLTIITKVNKTGLITNNVNITSEEHDNNKSNDNDSYTISVSPASDLSIVKQVNNSHPNYHDSVSWTVIITNYGPDVAHNITITDILPDSLIPLNPSKWFVESLGVLESASFELITFVNGTGLLTNNVIVNCSEFDSNLNNNNASCLINVSSAVDLEITKFVNDSNPNYSDIIKWTITVTNHGPDTATNVKINEIIPNSLELINHDLSKGNFKDNIWFIDEIQSNNFAKLDILTRVIQTGNSINIVNVTSDEFDYNSSNNVANKSFLSNSAIDLKITKKANCTSPNYNDFVKWTITVTNDGPDVAHNISVVDILPDSLIPVEDYPNWFVESLAVLESVSFEFVTFINGTGLLTNKAIVNCTEFDHNLDNNNASCLINVSSAVDLEITKFVNNSNPNYLDIIKWTIIIKNNGPDAATNVKVNEFLPNSLELISYDLSKGYFKDNVWFIDEVPANNLFSLEILTRVIQTGNSTNWVNVTSDEFDYNTSNNIVNKSFSTNPAIDLKITKRVNNTSPNYNDFVKWTITVTNNGPDKANNIEIHDLLPYGLSLVNYTATKGYYENGIWKYCCVEVGEIVTLDIITQVITTGELINQVNGSADEFDYNKSNNHDLRIIKVSKASDLQIIKSINQSIFNYHDLVKWNIVVKNNGPDDATNVTVNEKLPARLTLISTSDDENYSADGIWYVGNLISGESKQLELITRIDTTGEINNIVTVIGDQYDGNKSNDRYNKSISIPPAANLKINKLVSNSQYYVGDSVEYVIEVFNYGPDTAENIVVNEIMDSSLVLDSVLMSVGDYDYINNIWNIKSLANGENAQLFIKAIATKEGFFSNKVNISCDTFDDDFTNNYDEVIVEIIGNAVYMGKSSSSIDIGGYDENIVVSKNLNNIVDETIELENTGIPIYLLIFVSLFSLAFCNINIFKKR